MKMDLSKRERQILEILYRTGAASTASVQEELADGSSYSAVRGMLRVLSEKGLVQHKVDGAKYVYSPATPRDEAARSALQGLVTTFFSGSIEQVVATLLSERDMAVTPAELDRLAKMIAEARKGKQ
jgi:BlaI family transcriptional regulator, penicillinase repressor